MIRISLIAALALAASAGLAAAQGSLASNPPTQTTLCMDVGGQTLPVICTAQAGKLEYREDICHCPQGQQIKVPVCAKGQKPPIETRAFEHARKAAAADGSLIGDLYEGKPMCLAQRQP
jgi:hypothetical protein